MEDMNAGVNILSCGTSNPGKIVSWDKIIESVNEWFTLDAHKIYVDSCATYHSSFLRWMLGNVHQVSTVLQVNYNDGVSTSDEKRFFGLLDLGIWYWNENKKVTKVLCPYYGCE